MLANGEQFLLLITHPLSYSYTQWSPEIYRNAIEPFIALYDDIIFLYTLITINLSYVDIFIHKLYLIAQVKKEHKEVKKHKHRTQGWINNYNYTKNLTLHIFYYIKVIRQFGCFTENLQTRKITWHTTQTYIMKRKTIGCSPRMKAIIVYCPINHISDDAMTTDQMIPSGTRIPPAEVSNQW